MPPSSRPTAEELEQQLADQYNQIAQLAGGLAHEIKNPLSTIRLNMELLAEDFAEAPSLRERRALAKVEVVQRECQRLQDLLEDFLNFTRLRKPKLKPADLNRKIEQVLDFYAPQARESGIEVIRYLHPELPSVLLDEESFHRALLNLILNAQQAMPDGGQLVVRTTPLGTGVALYLIDTGCGMDDRTTGQIFNAFFSTKPGGSGLGLPTTRKIIEAHGGQIKVESDVGRGTKFTVELPVPPRLTASPEPAAGGQ
jgi:signal transduction histidine kinase